MKIEIAIDGKKGHVVVETSSNLGGYKVRCYDDVGLFHSSLATNKMDAVRRGVLLLYSHFLSEENKVRSVIRNNMPKWATWLWLKFRGGPNPDDNLPPTHRERIDHLRDIIILTQTTGSNDEKVEAIEAYIERNQLP